MFLPFWIVAPLTRLPGMGTIETSTWTAWLEPSGAVMAALILLVLCFAAWAANLVALPGNWICVALLAFYAWLGPQEGRANLGYGAVVAAGLFALIGELLEFLASALGAQRAGASRRSTLYALLGSIGGAIAGAIVGLPVPVVGPILAAILFAGLGATAGAMIGEWSDGRPWRENWNIGRAAFWGRTFGTLAKVTAGLIIVLIAIAGVLI
jgi:uncharacterized protein YqgC (DUF456 family)